MNYSRSSYSLVVASVTFYWCFLNCHLTVALLFIVHILVLKFLIFTSDVIDDKRCDRRLTVEHCTALSGGHCATTNEKIHFNLEI